MTTEPQTIVEFLEGRGFRYLDEWHDAFRYLLSGSLPGEKEILTLTASDPDTKESHTISLYPASARRLHAVLGEYIFGLDETKQALANEGEGLPERVNADENDDLTRD